MELKNITLVIIDCIDKNRMMEAIKCSRCEITFDQVKVFTSLHFKLPEKVSIRRIIGKEDYSKFVLFELNDYIDTDYVLFVQWDGYVVNPTAWTDEFLKYDYIGAPWKHRNDLVGNGGFSLRSKKLLNLLQQKYKTGEFIDYFPEDHVIGVTYREQLINEGIKFAPTDLAFKFSAENRIYNGSFGFHGGNFPKGFIEWHKQNKN